MRKPDLNYEKLVLVCINERTCGKECCSAKGSLDIYHAIKTEIKSKNPKIRVSRTGCLGNCKSGPIVVIMPDNIWLGDVHMSDVPEVIQMILDTKLNT